MKNILGIAVLACMFLVCAGAIAEDIALTGVTVESTTLGDGEEAWYTGTEDVFLSVEQTGTPTHYLVKEVYHPDEDAPELDGSETWTPFASYLINYAIQGGEGKVTLYVWLKDAQETVGPVGGWIVYSTATPDVADISVRAWGHSLDG